MKYNENVLSYKDYHCLRESVGWENFSEIQAENAIRNSLYTITVMENNETIATSILSMLLKYVEDHTPAGGRSSIQLIAEKDKEPFYETLGFKKIPHEFCGSGMRKVIYKK